MTFRVWLVSILAICFIGATAVVNYASGSQVLGTSSWKDGQNAGSNAGQNGAQQQKQNENQNQNQDQNAKKEESKPQAPTYLTYTEEANPGLQAGKSSKTEPVEVKSNPAGADVTVNGYFVGKTPTTVQVPPGKYIILVRKWGYEDWVRETDVSSGKPTNLDAKLSEGW